ncbi:MAG: hypothetical protein LBE84_10570 [Planctomycetota bacterium]|nr:hypothetical protein [Planctomycetota bacterium]
MLTDLKYRESIAASRRLVRDCRQDQPLVDPLAGRLGEFQRAMPKSDGSWD